MKLAILNDTHWGCRNDSPYFLDYTKRFLEECFFPYIEEYKITTIFHLGDLVDRRKYINFKTLTRLRVDFLEKLKDKDFHILAGNHDVHFKSTNEINALQELVADRYPYKIYTEPTEIELGGIKILLLPWINQENKQKSFDLLSKTTARICFGHLELQGFESDRGNVRLEGDDPSLFDKFDMVLTGHYHHKSTNGTVFYLGSCLQFSWADFNDYRGFHIFDTETNELTWIQNPFNIFKKAFYNDEDKTIDEVVNDFDFDFFKDSFVKVVVEQKNNSYWFDLFIERLEKSGAVNIQIVDDHHNLDVEDTDDIIFNADDTLTIFKNYIDQIDDTVDKEALKTGIQQLYQEAINLDSF